MTSPATATTPASGSATAAMTSTRPAQVHIIFVQRGCGCRGDKVDAVGIWFDRKEWFGQLS